MNQPLSLKNKFSHHSDLIELLTPNSDKTTSNKDLSLANPLNDKQTIIIGDKSKELSILGEAHGASFSKLSLRIEGVDISHYSQALDLLERLSSSLFFQINLLRNIPLKLVRRMEQVEGGTGSDFSGEKSSLEFPRYEYDSESISLYLYAQTAWTMPLYQYLAYYQATEFYFPVFAQAEALKTIRNVIKSPSFRVEKDSDIEPILATARATTTQYGDERSQLRATLAECVDVERLRSFLFDSDMRREHFSKKLGGLTDKKISDKTSDQDLLSNVTDRVYEIRCKIVHTKRGGRDGANEVLLPSSPEVEKLSLDIGLIEFIARHVLAAASTPLRLQ